jgi:hypothetical protein
MKTLTKYFLHFCVWQMQLEYDIGCATGMNHRYLAGLRQRIREMEHDLRMMEVQL